MDQPLLFVPDAEDFYGFELEDFANASHEEMMAMVRLNGATANWIDGKISTADYTDILSSYDIDPDEHLQDTDWFYQQILKRL